MSAVSEASGLDHSLNSYLRQLAGFNSTKELEASPEYAAARPEIDRVLSSVHIENGSRPYGGVRPAIRAVAWNIERGTRLEGIAKALREHPALDCADLLLLTELDHGMARSSNRFVAREIASELGFNVAFAPCYLALTKGSGLEAHVEIENTLALHGNALLSRFPLRRAHSLALPNGKDKMHGAEKRIGCQRAVIADVEHPHGDFRAVTLHLDAHSSQRHRHLQMRLLLDHLDTLSPQLPVIIGGDWNTTTHDASRALYSILGYFRRVMMGVRHVVQNHYPYPERWFERHLFRELERRGYDYRGLNVAGDCTLHYDVSNISAFKNLAEWVPLWCFSFIDWALKDLKGKCSLKLDWFAGKRIRPRSTAIVHEVNIQEPLSDHDPIVLEFCL
jgi:endonuclease/exonuclease/phosphatase family metal-dependent hydrolase